MEYYIDGHNLIPKVSGIQLSDDNDEEELLVRLQEYSRLSRRNCTVFFDKAPDNQSRDSSYGTLHVVYVTHHIKADEEIIARVNKLGRNRTREITVVSSDQHVQWQCRQVGAAVISSENFSSDMERIFSSGGKAKKRTAKQPHLEPKLSRKEVDEWLEIFGEK